MEFLFLLTLLLEGKMGAFKMYLNVYLLNSLFVSSGGRVVIKIAFMKSFIHHLLSCWPQKFRQ